PVCARIQFNVAETLVSETQSAGVRVGSNHFLEDLREVVIVRIGTCRSGPLPKLVGQRVVGERGWPRTFQRMCVRSHKGLSRKIEAQVRKTAASRSTSERLAPREDAI